MSERNETYNTMSNETITLASIQYVKGGDLESVRRSLIKSLTMNSIPFFQGDYSETARLEPADVFQLFSPRWSAVGRIELETVDSSQVLLRFCLPTFPTEAVVESNEEAIREALPPPAAVIRIIDADGDRTRALAYLGRYLHQFRIQRLQEIQSVLQNTLGLTPGYGLIIERQRVLDPVSLAHKSEVGKDDGARDIPRDDLTLRDDQQELLRLWQSGQTAKVIALRTSKTEKTILNQLTLLRKSLGEELVPRRR
jgi:DNA-binding CsgD family transcriptional regulator